jgi:hypothetical protein
MIVWLNGPFGAGKTTVAGELGRRRPDLVEFDTERVGFLLQPVLNSRRPVDDFQEWPAWRRLVVATIRELARELASDILVPQTVLVEGFWREIRTGLVGSGLEVRAFTLHVDPVEHARRIDADRVDAQAAGWRHRRLPDYDRARSWLERETTVIDTTSTAPDRVADLILDHTRL